MKTYSFDPEQNLIWEATETTLVLKGDPEKKEIKLDALVMVKKVLGKGEKKVDAVTRYGSMDAIQKRMQELVKLPAA